MDYEIFIRFLLAALWGGIVGAERQYRGKSAGFRTVIMISIGACFFTMMSDWIGGPANRDRIAANIVTGIGFLGAGVIFRGDNHINGITTAATVWAVAAVGMGIGAGFYFAAAYACGLIMFVLLILPYCERMIDQLNQTKEYSIKCVFSEGATTQYEQLMKQFHLRYILIRHLKEGNNMALVYEVQGSAKNHQLFIAAAVKEKSIERFGF
jgi:putative Mg2+ transporter-C (MgtC) family protein